MNLTDKRKKYLPAILILIGLGYFILWIFPNLTGSRDANMLAVFEVDEFAFYPHVIRMLTPGDTFYQSIRNFTVYLHYYYGYPFFFFSALSLLPVKIFSGAGWEQNTRLIVLFLRQFASVLPMILSVGVLTFTQTRFRSLKRSVFLMVFLLIVPGVFTNNYFWHPDSLLMLFLSGVFLFLSLDHLKFGRWFFLAAVCSGLATGTKHMGVLFGLTIPVYLLWGIISRRITLRRSLVYALLFVLIMAAAIVAANPLLLLPQERAEILSIQKRMFFENTGGFFIRNLDPFFKNGEYPQDFREHFGEAWFILLALAGALAGLFQKEKRLNSILILTWSLPVFIYLVFLATTRRTHYFIPFALPLFACLDNFFSWTEHARGPVAGSRFRRGVWGALVILIGVQAYFFIRTDVERYISTLNRENTSASIQFFNRVEKLVPSPSPARKTTLIYRDWHVYVAGNPAWQIETSWDLPDNGYINRLSPDVLLLEEENVRLYSDPASLEKAVDPEKMKSVHLFYKDAAAGKIPGYSLVYQDHFGLAFFREAASPTSKSAYSLLSY